MPGGPTLKYSKDKKGKETIMNDPRVPQLRERLGIEVGDAADTTYDKTARRRGREIPEAEQACPANGQLTAADRRRRSTARRRERDADIIIVNMERWRWVPRDLGKTYVMVNIPDYHAAGRARRASSTGTPRSWSASRARRRRS